MYKKILEELEDAILVVDMSGNIIYQNKPFDIINNLIPIGYGFYKDIYDIIYSYSEKEISLDNQKYKLIDYKENTKLYQTIMSQQIDTITELPNRFMINQYLNDLYLQEDKCVLAMLDIDKFKEINDTYGHLYGDSILSELSSILKLMVVYPNFVGRYGGEEFLIILKEEEQEALLKLDGIRTHIEEHFQNLNYKITVSIGATVFEKDESIIKIIDKADQTLYYVKENGRNNVGFWDMATNKQKLLKKF